MDHVKQTTAGALKITSKIVIHKTAETIDDLICNKIADKITKVSKRLPKNNLEIVKSKTEILKE